MKTVFDISFICLSVYLSASSQLTSGTSGKNTKQLKASENLMAEEDQEWSKISEMQSRYIYIGVYIKVVIYCTQMPHLSQQDLV